jgi:phosphatidylglycerophosphate synthase
MTNMAGKGVRGLARVRREQIPWAMATGRAALGPVLIVGAACSWNPMALAAMVVAALLSDIFDGVLARRWGSDTPGVRLFDTVADTVFYLCTAVALWIAHPDVLRHNARLLAALLLLEGARLGFDLAKFGKPASYHSYLAKTWGLVMATAVTATFATRWGAALMPLALGLGIACNLEGLAMSVVLPFWRKDVKGLSAARRMRSMQNPKEIVVVPKLLARLLVVAVVCLVAAPAFAVSAGEAAYVGGTTASVPNGTLGTLDTAAAEVLAFRYKSPTSAATGEIDIPYAKISNFQYSTEVAHHIGVLPAIAVSLVKRRERKHFFTISYSDKSNATEVAIFEVPKGRPPALLAILRARASQACGKLPVNACGGKAGQGSGW